MSLIDGARELAKDEFQMGCAVEHVFLAALPPYGYKNLDTEARKALDIFTGETLDKWRLQVLAKPNDFKDPPPIGQDSADLKEVLELGQKDAEKNKRERDDDRSLLHVVALRT